MEGEIESLPRRLSLQRLRPRLDDVSPKDKRFMTYSPLPQNLPPLDPASSLVFIFWQSKQRLVYLSHHCHWSAAPCKRLHQSVTRQRQGKSAGNQRYTQRPGTVRVRVMECCRLCDCLFSRCMSLMRGGDSDSGSCVPAASENRDLIVAIISRTS